MGCRLHVCYLISNSSIEAQPIIYSASTKFDMLTIKTFYFIFPIFVGSILVNVYFIFGKSRFGHTNNDRKGDKKEYIDKFLAFFSI